MSEEEERNLKEERSQAIKFWEMRRIIFLLILIPPTFLGYFTMCLSFSRWDGQNVRCM